MSGCSSSRRSGRAAASRRQRGGWAVIGPRCIASWPAGAAGRAMTPAGRTRRRARGRDESERPSWRSIGCWPPRSRSWSAPAATRSPQRCPTATARPRSPPRSPRRWAASPPRSLRRAPGRRRGHRGAGPPARRARAQPHLGPRPRNGPLGRRRSRARHRGVLLRAALAVAATHQRAHQRSAAPMAPQRHQPRHRAAAPCGHRGQPQPHAPPTPPLGISTRHLHSTHLQPPIELADVRPGECLCHSVGVHVGL